MHSANTFTHAHFSLAENLVERTIVEGSWQTEEYAAWHRLAWSGMQAHQQLLALLRAAHLQGCHVYFEYPAGGLGEVEDLYIQPLPRISIALRSGSALEGSAQRHYLLDRQFGQHVGIAG